MAMTCREPRPRVLDWTCWSRFGVVGLAVAVAGDHACERDGEGRDDPRRLRSMVVSAHRPRLRLRFALMLSVFVLVVFPASAQAHGATDPVASNYLARLGSVPAGLQAHVVDGDLRMWIRVPADRTVVVLDYNHAPYLRFTRAGVAVNQNSVMYYYNLVPPSPPPARLTHSAPPRWQRVSSGHTYLWHDGRLQDLAAQELRPGQRYVGVWRVPLLVDGRATALSGGVWFRPPPSPVWFWPIVVIVLCVVAAWRVKNPRLDQRTARLLALGALGAVAVVGIGRGLHGRPGVSVFQLLELGLILAFVLWGLFRVLVQRAGYFLYLLIGIVALWQGLVMIPTLFHGFVLIALPAFVARAATVLALGAAAGLCLMVFRLFDQREESSSAEEFDEEDVGAWRPV